MFSHRNAIVYASLHTRLLILLIWKKESRPAYIHWIREVMLGLDLEYLRCLTRGSEDKCNKSWSQFIAHIKNLRFAPLSP